MSQLRNVTWTVSIRPQIPHIIYRYACPPIWIVESEHGTNTTENDTIGLSMRGHVVSNRLIQMVPNTALSSVHVDSLSKSRVRTTLDRRLPLSIHRQDIWMTGKQISMRRADALSKRLGIESQDTTNLAKDIQSLAISASVIAHIE